MFSILQTFHPNPILISIGPVNVYWYGFFIVMGILLGILVILKASENYEISKEWLIDTSFWLILGGIAGARIYSVFIDFDHYSKNWIDIFKIWQGGLAIHGAIIAGAIIIVIATIKKKFRFWDIASLAVLGLPLGQAIGRWGNYFNQELFGTPTDLPWKISISMDRRPIQYFKEQYFHPTFLYESLGNLAIFCILIYLHYHPFRKYNTGKIIVGLYLCLYSALRFFNEFLRIDSEAIFLNMKIAQLVSLVLFAVGASIISYEIFLTKNKKTESNRVDT